MAGPEGPGDGVVLGLGICEGDFHYVFLQLEYSDFSSGIVDCCCLYLMHSAYSKAFLLAMFH